MTNNETFKTLLQLTGLSKEKQLIAEIFSFGGITASQSKIKGWRTDVDNPRSSHMPDDVLRGFFKGLFEYRDKRFTDDNILVFNFVENDCEHCAIAFADDPDSPDNFAICAKCFNNSEFIKHEKPNS